jgi:hypothetical protein
MIVEHIKNNELDRLVNHALASDPNLSVPYGLTEKTIRILEKKLLLHQLVTELFVKGGLVLGSLIVLAGVFFWINGNRMLILLSSFLTGHWQMIASILLLVLITILIDQIGLRFYFSSRKEAGLKI